MNKKILGLMWGCGVSLLTGVLFIKYNFAVWTYYVGAVLILPAYFFLFRTHRTDWIYRNTTYGFEMRFPARWDQGVFGKPETPAFYGSSRESLKIAIGLISPEPDVQTQQNELVKIATKYGQTILDVGTIQICGKEHATILVKIPGIGTLKNYSLIFDEIEYLITANVAIADSIVQSFEFYR